MKGEIELHNISFLILKVELHFKFSNHRWLKCVTFWQVFITIGTKELLN